MVVDELVFTMGAFATDIVFFPLITIKPTPMSWTESCIGLSFIPKVSWYFVLLHFLFDLVEECIFDSGDS